MNKLEKYIESANTLAFKVVDEETSDVIGHISLGQIDNINKSARIGKVLVGNTKMRGTFYRKTYDESSTSYCF